MNSPNIVKTAWSKQIGGQKVQRPAETREGSSSSRRTWGSTSSAHEAGAVWRAYSRWAQFAFIAFRNWGAKLVGVPTNPPKGSPISR